MQISIELLAILVGLFGGGITFVYGYGTLNAKVNELDRAMAAQAAAHKEALEKQDLAHKEALLVHVNRTNVIEKRHYELDNHVARELSGVRESLARIEGALGVKQKS